MESEPLRDSWAAAEHFLPHDFFHSLQAKVNTVLQCNVSSTGIVDLLVPLEAAGKSLEDYRPCFMQHPSTCAEVWRIIVGPAHGSPETSVATGGVVGLVPWVRALAKRLCEVKATEASKVLVKALGVLGLVLRTPFRRGGTSYQLRVLRDGAWYVLNCFHVMRTAFAVQTEAVWLLDAVAAPSAWMEDDSGLTDMASAVLSAEEYGVVPVAELCITMASADNKEGAGAKSAAVQLLGHLCRCYDVAIASTPGLAASALKCFMKVADRLTDSAKAPQELGKGFFRGITEFLQGFPLDYRDEKERGQLILLCHLCHGALGVALDTQAYGFTLAALEFLHQHAAKDLAEPLYATATDMYPVLRHLWEHKNTPVRRAAYSATMAFFRALAGKMIEHREDLTARDLLAGVLRSITASLQDPMTSPSQVSLSLVALGCMAGPIRHLDSPDVLQQVFRLLLEKSQVILLANSGAVGSTGASPSDTPPEKTEWQTDIVRLLPHFLAAFSSFVVELPALREDGVAAVERLVDVVVSRYPAPVFFPRLKAVVVPALLRLLASLQWQQRQSPMPANCNASEDSDSDDGAVADDIVPACGARVTMFLCRRTFELAFAANVWRSGPAAELVAAGADPDPAAEPPTQLTSAARVLAYTELWRSLLSDTAAEVAAKALAVQMTDGHALGGAGTAAAACTQAAQTLLRLSCLSVAQELVEHWDLAVVDTRTKAQVSLQTLVLRQRRQQYVESNAQGGPAALTASAAAPTSGYAQLPVPTPGEQPRSPEDYRCFLLFVPFYAALAYSLWKPAWAGPVGHGDAIAGSEALSEFFSEWLLLLVHASRLYPHVSGVFHILYATLLSGNKSYAKNTPAPACAPAANGLIMASARARAAVRQHYVSCAQRLHALADELLYQCSMFVVAAAASLSESSATQHPAAVVEAEEQRLLLPLRVVLAAHSTLAEDEAYAALLVRNRCVTLHVLKQRLRANAQRVPLLLPPLVATPELAESAMAREGLAELAAEFGTQVAAALHASDAHGKATKTGTVLHDTPVPQWLVDKWLLEVPMPAGKAVAFRVGRLIGPVAELCLHGATRKQRTTASELFHFIVTWLIGKGATEWYDKVFPVVTELAAGAEESEVVAGLFHDLLYQCARWFASAPPTAVEEKAREHLERVLLSDLGHPQAARRRTATGALVEYIGWIGHSARGPSSRALDEAVQTRLERLTQKIQAALVADQALRRLGATGFLRELLERPRPDQTSTAANWFEARPLLRWLRALFDALEMWISRSRTQPEDAGAAEEVATCLSALSRQLKGVTLEGKEQRRSLQHRAVHLALRISSTPHTVAALETQRLLRHALIEDVFPALRVEREGAAQFVERNMALFSSAATPMDGHHDISASVTISGTALTLVALAHCHCDEVDGSSTRENEGEGEKTRKRPRASAGDHKAFTNALTAVFVDGGASAVMEGLLTPTPKVEACVHHDECEAILSAATAVLTLCLEEAWDTDAFTFLGGETLCRLAAAHAVLGGTDTAEAPPSVAQQTRAVPACVQPLATVCRALQAWPRTPNARAMQTSVMRALQTSLLPLLSPVAHSGTTPSLDTLTGPISSAHRQAIIAATALMAVEPAGDGDAPHLWYQWVASLPIGTARDLLQALLSTLQSGLQAGTTGVQYRDQQPMQAAAALWLASGQGAGGVAALVQGIGWTHAAEEQRTTGQLVSRSIPSASSIDVGDTPVDGVASLKRVADTVAAGLARAASAICRPEERVCFLLLALESAAEGLAAVPRRLRSVLASLSLRTLRLLRGAATRHALENVPNATQRLATAVQQITEDRAAAHSRPDALALHLRVLEAAAEVDVAAVLALDVTSAGSPSGEGGVLQDRLALGLDVCVFGGRKRSLLSSTSATRRLLHAAHVACTVLRAGQASARVSRTSLAPLATLCVGVVHTVATDELPLRWHELSPDTKERAHYHQVVRALVSLAAGTAAVQPDALFELLPILSQTDLPNGERLCATVEAALGEMATDRLEALCDACVALQRSGLPRDVWWTATHRIFLPALRTFPATARTHFFARHVPTWVQTASAPSVGPRPRSNAFVLLEAMYRLADAVSLKGPINDAHARAAGLPTGSGTELTKALIKAATQARKGAAAHEGDEEALGLRQAAHRCLTAVLMATQTNEGVFRKLLLDADSVEWNLLARHDTWGPLPEAVDFPQIPDSVAKESSDWELRIRQFAPQEATPLMDRNGDIAALSQEAATGLTRGEGVSSDAWLQLSQSGVSGLLSSAARSRMSAASQPFMSHGAEADGMTAPLVDLDEVWKTTCSGALLALMDFMLMHFPSAAVGDGPAAPAWVVDVQRLLRDERIDLHMRLVFARLVQLRARTHFARFANLLAEPLLRVATDPALGDTLHYVARDAVVVVVDWMRSGHFVPDVEVSRRLLCFVVRTAPLTETTYHARCNVELFRELCSLVPVGPHGCLTASALLAVIGPSAAEAGSEGRGGGAPSSSRISVGVQLCGVVVDHGVPLAALASSLPSDVAALHAALVSALADPSDGVAVAAAEVLALELKALRATGETAPATHLQDMVTRRLLDQWAAQHAAPRGCAATLRELRVMQESCPEIVAAFLPASLFVGYVGLGATNQLLVLEVLGTAPELMRETPYFDALRSRFAGGLAKYTLPVCTALYVLLSLVVPHMAEEDLDTLTEAFLTDDCLNILSQSEDARVAFFKLASCVQRQLRAGTPRTSTLHRLLVTHGLKDPSVFVQDVVLEYMDGHLATCEASVDGRVVAVLDALSPSTTATSKASTSHGPLSVGRWLHHAAVLLLCPARRTSRFTDSKYLFPRPLQDCTFAPRSLTAATLGGGAACSDATATATATAAARQLPLFSLSLHAQGVGVGRSAAAALSQRPLRPTVTTVGASQQTQRQSNGGVAANEDRSGLSVPVVALRYSQMPARQGKALRSTVVPATSTALFTSFNGTLEPTPVHSSLLFTRKDDVKALESVGASTLPPRRLVALSESAKMMRSMHKSHQQRLSREMQERLRAAQQAQELVIYRDYRVGDIPDIETSLEAFVTPLQALCLSNERVAGLVCAAVTEEANALAVTSPKDGKTNSDTGRGGGGGSRAADSEAVPFFARPSPLPDSVGDSGPQHPTPERVQESLKKFVSSVLAPPPREGTAGEAKVALSPSPLLTRFALEMALLMGWAPPQDEDEGSGFIRLPSSASPLAGAAVELWMTTALNPAHRPSTKRQEHDQSDTAMWRRGCAVLMQDGDVDVALLAAQHTFDKDETASITWALHAARDGATDMAEWAFNAALTRRLQCQDEENKDAYQLTLLRHLRREAAASLLKWDAVLDTFPLAEAHSCNEQDSNLRLYAALRVQPTEAAAALCAALRGAVPTEGGAAASRTVGASAATHATDFLRGLALLLDRDGEGVGECVRIAQEALPDLVFAQRDFAEAHRLWILLDAARAVEDARRTTPAEALDVLTAYYRRSTLTLEQGPSGLDAAAGLLTDPATLLDNALAVQQGVWRRVSVTAELVDPADLPLLQESSTAALVAACKEGCEALVSSRRYNGAVYNIMKGVQDAVRDGSRLRKVLWVSVVRAQLHHTVFVAPYRTVQGGVEQVRALAAGMRRDLGFSDPTEASRLAADEALCTIRLSLQAGDVRLDALLKEAQSLHTAFGELQGVRGGGDPAAEHQDLVLLDALDSILTAAVLSGQSRSLTTDTPESTQTPLDSDVEVVTEPGKKKATETRQAGRSSVGDAAVLSPLEACWLLYVQTMSRALRRGGITGRYGPLLERVPRLLQVFELRVVRAAGHTDTHGPWTAALSDLTALPSVVWRPWLTQLINWLLRTEHATVATLLLQAARDNPQLAYYPVNCAVEDLRRLQERVPHVKELLALQSTSTDAGSLAAFVSAIHKLQYPGPRLSSALKRVFMDLQRAAKAPNATDSEEFYRRARARFEGCFDAKDFVPSETVHAAVVADITANQHRLFLGSDGKLARDPKHFKDAYNAANGIKKHTKKPASTSTQLSDYSAWLSALGASSASGTLSLPRQPATLVHTPAPEVSDSERIIAVNPTVQVMSSLQLPVRVRFLTTEGERDFLAKGGDDLRLDQRVEELFVLANGYLRRHEDANQRRGTALRIRHYSVVPVSLDMGLVEWVAGTNVLQGVMDSVLQADGGGRDIRSHSTVSTYTQEYPRVEYYTTSYRELRNEEVARWFDGLVRKTPRDLLLRGLHAMAPDRCAWHATRGAFVRTNAALASASYLFGIGDRHLGNCLVDKATGEAVSIDFGRAFGSATDALVVPELMPFRLSPQLQAVQGVLGNDLTGLYLQRAMAAYTAHRSSLEALATAFVYEPIMDWEYAHEAETGATVAEEKIMSVYRKLNLECPASLMKADVRRNKNPCVGNALHSIEATLDRHRATLPARTRENGLDGQGNTDGTYSEAERISAFVQSLVGMATDSSILGRTYAGWMPLF